MARSRSRVPAEVGPVPTPIGYRVGLEGFLPIYGVLTSPAVRRMIEALKSIQSTTVDFGGDPANVSVFRIR